MKKKQQDYRLIWAMVINGLSEYEILESVNMLTPESTNNQMAKRQTAKITGHLKCPPTEWLGKALQINNAKHYKKPNNHNMIGKSKKISRKNNNLDR
jgi:hypothetical protein